MSRHRLALLSLATTLVALASAQDNQCFYAANQRAGSVIVPCSSTGTYASCCQLGDLCLSDSACWNPTHNVTYLYGCTDSSYQDFTCPYKCGPTFANAPYVGLDYCSNTTNLEWSCTHPPNSDEAIQAFNYAAPCLDDSIIAFAGPVSLPPYLSLPTNIGGSTIYFSPTGGSFIPVTGYTPTTTVLVAASVPTTVEYVGSTSTSTTPSSSHVSSASPTSASPTPTHTSPSTSTTTSTSPSTSATSTSTSTLPSSTTTTITSSSASSSSSSPTGGLVPDHNTPTTSNTGLKVGLGVGIAGGVLFLAALILFFLLYRRRRQRHAAIPQHDDADAAYAAQQEKNNLNSAPRYQDSPAQGAGGAGFGHRREPSELSAGNPDTSHKRLSSPGINGASPNRSPVPLYSEFEGSPVPTHYAPQRFEMGDSR